MEGLRESPKAVGTVSVLVGIRPGYLPENKQKPHCVKQFIVEHLVLFCCCYKILRLGAAAESRRTGFFLHNVCVCSV